MKAHIEIKIHFKQLPDGGLHQILGEFAKQTKGWRFPKDQSEDYRRGAGYEAGFAVSQGRKDLQPAAVAVANLDQKHPSTFRVPNIVPRMCSSLSVDEHNAIGIAFVDFRCWLRTRSLRGSVEVIGPNRTLNEIIPGEKTRRLFETWLRTPTPVSHPSDLNVLDRFMCHLFRHPGNARIWEIEPYLVHDLNWKSETARWVATRIETGLELLRVDRKF
jgi:hypothetical protein